LNWTTSDRGFERRLTPASREPSTLPSPATTLPTPAPATALQAERLHALVDGLAAHTALRPELMCWTASSRCCAFTSTA
jgi:hypothetical protein